VLSYDRGLFVLLHAFHKKEDAIAQADIDAATRRMEDDRKRPR